HDVCDYNRGIYSAVPTLWGYAPAKVEENPCTFRGGDHCEIWISWGFNAGKVIRLFERVFSGRKRLRDFIEQVEKDKEELKERNKILKDINDATQTLVSAKNTQEVLDQTLKPIIEVLGFDRALIMVEDEHRKVLKFRHGQVENAEELDRLRGYTIPLTRQENLMVRVYHTGRAEMSQDPIAMGLNPKNPIIRDFHPGPSIVCPLDANGRTIGILGVTRRDASREVKESDREYVQIFANNIATAFARERLDQNLRDSYEGGLRAIVKLIEVNDTYTRGHSSRVADYSVGIARYLGYSEQQIENLKFGCILHDVGKIGLVSYLELQKSGPLSKEEYEKIKTHPVRGEEVLKENKFFQDTHRYIVRNHHERWDGTGYPDHLAGKEIPPEAQIVAVADAFDAMISDRPYRKGLPKSHAANEIKKCSGSQFSPKATEAFVQFYEEQIITGKFEFSE
ncbi:MAG: HD domain-containing protein, partial [Spirochaetes bacterium]|nr:HD domain-containing protein [Spirochaetota bacterium]